MPNGGEQLDDMRDLWWSVSLRLLAAAGERAVALVAAVLPGFVSLSAIVSRPSLFVFNPLATQMLFVNRRGLG